MQIMYSLRGTPHGAPDKLSPMHRRHTSPQCRSCSCRAIRQGAKRSFFIGALFRIVADIPASLTNNRQYKPVCRYGSCSFVLLLFIVALHYIIRKNYSLTEAVRCSSTYWQAARAATAPSAVAVVYLTHAFCSSRLRRTLRGCLSHLFRRQRYSLVRQDAQHF